MCKEGRVGGPCTWGIVLHGTSHASPLELKTRQERPCPPQYCTQVLRKRTKHIPYSSVCLFIKRGSPKRDILPTVLWSKRSTVASPNRQNSKILCESILRQRDLLDADRFF